MEAARLPVGQPSRHWRLADGTRQPDAAHDRRGRPRARRACDQASVLGLLQACGAAVRACREAASASDDRSRSPYILSMNENDVVERLGPPDEIVRREDRMRSRAWICSTCREIVTSTEPIPVPVPCAECGGIGFETARLGTAPCRAGPGRRCLPHGDRAQS